MDYVNQDSVDEKLQRQLFTPKSLDFTEQISIETSLWFTFSGVKKVPRKAGSISYISI